MPKNEPKPALKFPEADELTVQFSVPQELLKELAAEAEERTRIAPTPDAFQDEQTLLMLPAQAAKAVESVASAAPPPRIAPPPALRPMTPVNITDAEVSALLRPRRMARLAGIALLLLLALVVSAVALASR